MNAADRSQVSSPSLDHATASMFARMALDCIHTEFPNKPGHVIISPEDVRRPSELHPAFYGCYDWHSAVHSHWLLVRLLKRFPDLPEAPEIRQALNQNLTQNHLKAELDYFKQDNRKSFERTYGWAWYLKLSQELTGWQDRDGERWLSASQPLADYLVRRMTDFIPRQTYPIRTGVHPNTAFALAFGLDYARAVQDSDFIELLIERSKHYYLDDRDYPAEWEPGGRRFLFTGVDRSRSDASGVATHSLSWVAPILFARLVFRGANDPIRARRRL
jgi:hypothetical protein